MFHFLDSLDARRCWTVSWIKLMLSCSIFWAGSGFWEALPHPYLGCESWFYRCSYRSSHGCGEPASGAPLSLLWFLHDSQCLQTSCSLYIKFSRPEKLPLVHVFPNSAVWAWTVVRANFQKGSETRTQHANSLLSTGQSGQPFLSWCLYSSSRSPGLWLSVFRILAHICLFVFEAGFFFFVYVTALSVLELPL